MNKDFLWWTGVVEDRDDPEMLGRCRVRILGYHSDSTTDIPTDELPWAYPAMPINTRPRSTPIGPVEGTWVMGFFRDGESAQQPVMTHVLDSGYKPEEKIGEGFNDPGPEYREQQGYPERPKRNWWPGFTAGVFPGDGTINEDWPEVDESKINRLATGNTKGTWVNWADERRVTGVETAAPDGPAGTGNYSWSEPESEYNAQYPFNKVEESESGHVFEVDDTPGHERISRRHRSGSYEELQNDGRVIKIHGDDYEIIVANDRDPLSGSKNIYVDGNVNVTAAGDINLKTTEGNIRIDSDKSIRMKADEFIVMDAGIGILCDGMFFSTASGMPILHGGGSPMVVPTSLPTEISPDLGLKYASTGLSNLQDMIQKGLDVSPEIKEALTQFEKVSGELETAVVKSQIAIEEAKSKVTSATDTVAKKIAYIKDVQTVAADWKTTVEEKTEQATHLQKMIKDPEGGLTLAWAEAKSKGLGEAEELADKTKQIVKKKGDELKEKAIGELGDKAVQLQQLSSTFNSGMQAKDAVKKQLKDTMRKAMGTIASGLLTGSQIAFSITELISMVKFGRADADDPEDDSPYVIPLGIDSRIVWAGQYVIGKEYTINDMARDTDDDWMENWSLATGSKSPDTLRNGNKFIALHHGKGLGSVVLMFSTGIDKGVFDRKSKGSLVEKATAAAMGGNPILSADEMKEIKDKNTLIALIELFHHPVGSFEIEYFQTWLSEEHWYGVLAGIAESKDGYTNLADVRLKLRAIAVDVQIDHIPNILDARVEGWKMGATEGDILENENVKRAHAGHDWHGLEGYNYKGLLDRDDVLEYSQKKRTNSTISNKEELSRLIALEESFGIKPSEKIRLKRVVTFKDLGRRRPKEKVISYVAEFSQEGDNITYHTEGGTETSTAGFARGQKVIQVHPTGSEAIRRALRSPSRELRELQEQVKNVTDDKEKEALDIKIRNVKVNIVNLNKAKGKVWDEGDYKKLLEKIDKESSSAEVSTKKKQESNKALKPVASKQDFQPKFIEKSIDFSIKDPVKKQEIDDMLKGR